MTFHIIDAFDFVNLKLLPGCSCGLGRSSDQDRCSEKAHPGTFFLRKKKRHHSMFHHVSRFSMVYVYVSYCAEERLQSSSQHRTRHGEVHLCSACLAKSAANESRRGSERQHVPTENISLPRSSKLWITVDNCVKDTFPAPSQFESNLLKRACRLS